MVNIADEEPTYAQYYCVFIYLFIYLFNLRILVHLPDMFRQ
jgi:hypothetical protein